MFKNLKVVELASVLAGPAVGMFFSELGAEVVKVENKKTGGDMTRKWKLPEEDKSEKISAYFSSVNYNKKYLLKDFSVQSEQKEIHDIIKEADIVIANFKAGSAAKLSMDYSSLKSINPLIIYAQIEGFSSNPNKVAFDVVLQAETGFMSMNGYEDRDPAKLPVALIDILAAHHLKEGILLALLKKEKEGKGSFVSVSLEEAALASLANQASNYLMEGHIPKRMGSLHPNIAPYGEVFTTKDKAQIVLAVGTDHQFKALCDLVSCSQLPNEENYKNNAQRVINRLELKRILSPFIENFYVEDFINQCDTNKIPVGEIKNLKQVLDSPLAHQMTLSETIDGKETKRIRTVAFHLSDD
jgi:crotonobetainyl-CoA:carnitine CoA-transferase CaiB-like acyl-CoA transferase